MFKHHPTSAGAVQRWDERVGSGVTDEFSGMGVSPHMVTLFLDRSTQEFMLWEERMQSCSLDAEKAPRLFVTCHSLRRPSKIKGGKEKKE